MARYLNLKKIFKLLEKFQFDPELSNYEHTLMLTSELNKIPSLNNQFFLIFDIPYRKISYISDNITDLLRCDPDKINSQFIYNQIVAEDRNIVINASEYALKVCNEHPEIRILETSFEVDFRIRKWDGSIIRLLRKTCIYKKDKMGFPLQLLSLYTDISRLKKDDFVEVFADGPDKHLFNYSKNGQIKQKNGKITNQEMQILKKSSEDKSCQIMADEMGISINTVYTHRKNMLAKNNYNNMEGLVAFAIKEHLI